MKQYDRMRIVRRLAASRGLAAGTAAAIVLTWIVSAVEPGSGPTAPLVQSAVYVALFALAVGSPRVKVKLVRTVQRWTINPLMRGLLAIGLNPLGLAIVETRGRRSGRLRRTPVGNGRHGESFWIIAEHGLRAGYVQNIRADSRVRVRLRVGLRYRWIPGTATVLIDDDVLARQRQIVAWHPLRALNAINVRVLGADLVVVHVRLVWSGKPDGSLGGGLPTGRPQPAHRAFA